MIQTKKISDTDDFVKTIDMIKLANDISRLGGGAATKSELTAVENKIADVSSLVKKTDLNSKLLKQKVKYLVLQV